MRPRLHSPPEIAFHHSAAFERVARACRQREYKRARMQGSHQNLGRVTKPRARARIDLPPVTQRNSIASSLRASRRAAEPAGYQPASCLRTIEFRRFRIYSAASPESVAENAARNNSSNSGVGSCPYHRRHAIARASSSVPAATTEPRRDLGVLDAPVGSRQRGRRHGESFSAALIRVSPQRARLCRSARVGGARRGCALRGRGTQGRRGSSTPSVLRPPVRESVPA